MNGPISSSMEETAAPRLKKNMEKIKVEGMALISFKAMLVCMGLQWVLIGISFLRCVTVLRYDSIQFIINMNVIENLRTLGLIVFNNIHSLKSYT